MNKINKVLQVGNLANQIESTRENPNRHRVYLPNGIAPALCTMSGGGLQPEIVVAETRDKRQETRDKRQETRDCNDLLSACQGNCIREGIENCINHTDKRLQGIRKYQRKCNNNQRDIIFYGNLNGKNIQGYTYSVYAINGICATLTTSQGGGREPLILIHE